VLLDLDPIGRMKTACEFAADDDFARDHVGCGLRFLSNGEPLAIQKNRAFDKGVKT
jgi:hypothetical protein